MSLTYHQLRALQYRATADSYRLTAKASEYEARTHQLDIKGPASAKAELNMRECLRHQATFTKLAEDYEKMAVEMEREDKQVALIKAKQGVCPTCGSENIESCHHVATFAAPECDYKQCEECGAQFDHA